MKSTRNVRVLHRSPTTSGEHRKFNSSRRSRRKSTTPRHSRSDGSSRHEVNADDVVLSSYVRPESQRIRIENYSVPHHGRQHEMRMEHEMRMNGQQQELRMDGRQSAPIHVAAAAGEYLEEQPTYGASSHKMWRRAASGEDDETLQVALSLVMYRRDQKYRSGFFQYERGTGDDDFAHILKSRYRQMKGKMSLLQRVISHKTISFIIFLQMGARAVNGEWELRRIEPVLDGERSEAEQKFMSALNEKSFGRKIITKKLDELIERGVVIDIEVKETFDIKVVFLGILFGIFASLAVGLGYGFGMGRDFSTGFSIASWMLTAFGFIFAVIAAGEWFGLKKASEGSMVADTLERGELVTIPRFRTRIV